MKQETSGANDVFSTVAFNHFRCYIKTPMRENHCINTILLEHLKNRSQRNYHRKNRSTFIWLGSECVFYLISWIYQNHPVGWIVNIFGLFLVEIFSAFDLLRFFGCDFYLAHNWNNVAIASGQIEEISFNSSGVMLSSKCTQLGDEFHEQAFPCWNDKCSVHGGACSLLNAP